MSVVHTCTAAAVNVLVSTGFEKTNGSMVHADRLERDARTFFEAAVRGAAADVLLERLDWKQLYARGAGRVRIVAMGKAALPMAAVAGRAAAAAGRTVADGLVVVPQGYGTAPPARLPRLPRALEAMEGGHPAPTEASLRAGEKALAMAERSREQDLLLVLISGGGTALCNAFAHGLSLEDVRRSFALLLGSGADIHAMNAVRKHLSRTGGGQLARAAHPARTLALVISDVPGDDLSVIASGPTVPDPSTFVDARDLLQQRSLWARLPEAVRRHVQAGCDGTVAETPGPGAVLFDRAETRLVGSNRDALDAACAAARSAGYRAIREEDVVTGEARSVGEKWAEQAQAVWEDRGEAQHARLYGGETTVTVRGNGTGGRNQELALAAALVLDGSSAPVAVFAGGTDGIDGPTDAAGAVVTPRTAGRIRAAGLDPRARLDDNDAHAALDAAGALIRTGPTHTNVMDVGGILVGAHGDAARDGGAT